MKVALGPLESRPMIDYIPFWNNFEQFDISIAFNSVQIQIDIT